MGAQHMVYEHERIQSYNQSSCDANLAQSSHVLVTRYLDSALQMWEDDRIQAKSHVKIAVSMLRSYTVEPLAGNRNAAAPAHARGLAPWQTRKVTEFIDGALDSTIRLRDCASRVRLSTSHFARAFKATFGTTAGHYVRCRRIERAQNLMLRSNEPLSQVAVACGFADQAHYCRVFRNVVGQSPGAWRRQTANPVLDE